MKEIPMVCIVCPNGCSLSVTKNNDGKISVSGNTCKRGEQFALNEMTMPMRSLTTSVKTVFHDRPVLPVRTFGEIPKSKIPLAMKQLSSVVVDKKVSCGEIIFEHIAGTDCNVIATINLD